MLAMMLRPYFNIRSFLFVFITYMHVLTSYVVSHLPFPNYTLLLVSYCSFQCVILYVVVMNEYLKTKQFEFVC